MSGTMSSNAPRASSSRPDLYLRWTHLVALTFCACATTALPTATKTADPERAAFDAWVTAVRLFQQGLRDADGEALVTAARLMERYPPRAELDFETEPGRVIAPSPIPFPSAAESHRLAELHGHVPFPAVAPIGPGPRHLTHELGPEGRDFVSLEAGPGMAEVALVSDARSDLDLWVFDASGATLCFDVEVGDAACRWFVASASDFEVIVKNTGDTSTRYTLLFR